MTSRTPGRFSKAAGPTVPLLPVMPIAVRWAPGIGSAFSPSFSAAATTPSTSLPVAVRSMTMSTAGVPLPAFILHVAAIARSPAAPEVPMPRHGNARAAAALLALALAWAGTATATYVIFTKDGKRIEAQEKPVVKGKRLTFLTPLGSPQSIALEEFDQERSDKVNKEGLGNAYILDDPNGSRS